MTVGSLFAGIGGFDLGFERAGFEIVWQVEIDEYCRRVLERHFPRAERFGDIRECGIANLRPVSILCGGFPCQDISTAGQRAGINGEKSGLWKEMLRVIRELRPEYVIVENVSALLFRGMETVLGDLADSGYDAEWDRIPACAIGAPHIRERIWIVAYPHSDRERCILGGFCEHSSHDESPNESLSQFAALAKSEWNWSAQPCMAGVADGVPEYMDRYAHLGNAVVPQIAQWIAERIKQIFITA